MIRAMLFPKNKTEVQFVKITKLLEDIKHSIKD